MFAGIHLFPAAGIAAILATALAKNGVTSLATWLVRNFDLLLIAMACSIVGALNLARPSMMIRRSLLTHPELADDKRVVTIARLLGFLFVFMAVWALGFARTPV